MKFLPLLFLAVTGGRAFSQTIPEDLVKAANKNCWVWKTDFLPQDSLTVNWDGDCTGRYAQGPGSIAYLVGNNEVARYRGLVQNGYPEGEGQFIFQDGYRMKGNFVKGIMNGEGQVIFPDTTYKLTGNFYDGNILNLDRPYLDRLHRNVIATWDPTNMYVGDREHTELFYYALVPDRVRAVIVLLPGTWDGVEYVLSSNKKLCQLAYDHHIAVLALSVNQRLSLNEEVLAFINAGIEDAVKRYRLPAGRFIIGGFSMGGLFSLRYAELSRQDKTRTAVQPLAVYCVDGPIDLESIYHRFEIALERSPNKTEPAYALNEFKNHFKGSPEESRETYLYYSAFSYSEKDGGNARYLKDMPVRIYNDVDVSWWIENRNADLYAMNAVDQSAMINLLRMNGNARAEFINAYQKGYRLEGMRHPHSWSIVDPEDCIHWIHTILQE